MLEFQNAKNAQISVARRGDGFDRYGQSQLETVFFNVMGRLEKGTDLTRSSNGDTVDISGTLYLDPSFELKPRDIITINNDDQDQYTIFDVKENIDILGKVVNRTYTLQQKTKL